MTPAARVQAAIEILDEVIASCRDNGPPADVLVTRYFKTRRYAGSKDRRAVRELVFRAIRNAAEVPSSGRAAILGLLDEEINAAFGEPRGPDPIAEGESVTPSGTVPDWLVPEISHLVDAQEWPALLERAPLDLRVNIARTDRAAVLQAISGAQPTPFSPWGVRMPPGTRIDDHPMVAQGLVEVQDEGSQLIALACYVDAVMSVIDLCAGAGGKALALAAAAPDAKILATDSNRDRLARLAPRASRAGATIATQLLDPPNELEQLSDWKDRADLVVVDAPCSGSGTWRRNPEGRWRLTPARLDQLVALQSRLLGIAANLVRPGGTLVYAVCSILTREGAGRIDDFLSARSSWKSQDAALRAGRADGGGLWLTPGHDRTDGFFVARLVRGC